MGVNGIYGLSGSGLDVESMVKVGMMSKQKELDKMQQKYTQNEWKKAEYLDLYSEVQTFNNSTLSQYKLSSNMNSRAATSSNEAAVTVSANANAAPMQHYVEVGQLASAAYLVGTEPIARMNTSATSSSELKNILFASLTKNDTDGKYEYTVTGTDTPTTGLDASDVAFTFKIGDGSTGKDYVNSSNENIFSAEVVDNSGNVLSIPSNTSSHTVLLESYETSPEKITALKLDGINFSSSTDTATSIKNVFKTMFGMSDQEYLNRFSRLASAYADTTAFTIKFDDDSDSSNSNYSAEFKYSDLTVTTANSFLQKIRDALNGSNISVIANSDGQLEFSNSTKGGDSRINISIDTGSGNTNTFIGQKNANNVDFRLTALPQIISASDPSLVATATAYNVFTSLLAMDEYGGTDTAKKYLDRYATSDDVALSILFTDTKNGSSTTGTSAVDITFKQLASSSYFTDVLKNSLTAAGLTNLGNNISINVEDNVLKISHAADNNNATLRGTNNSIAFEIRNVGIGDEDHPYILDPPTSKIISGNPSMKSWFEEFTGISETTYQKRLAELKTDPSFNENAPALTLNFDDGIHSNPATITISYKQLSYMSNTRIKLSDYIGSGTTNGTSTYSTKAGFDTNTTNIRIYSDSNQIKIYNDTLGSDSTINVTAKLDSNLQGDSIETNGKINLNVVSTTTMQTFFSSILTQTGKSFTAGDQKDWKTDDGVAFTLQFKDSDGTPAVSTAIDIKYKDLVDSSTSSLYNKLHNKLGSNYNVRIENGNIVVYNTESGENSHIQAVITNSKIGYQGDGAHWAGSGTKITFSNTVDTGTLKSIINDDQFAGFVSNDNATNSMSDLKVNVSITDNKNSTDTITLRANTNWSGVDSKIGKIDTTSSGKTLTLLNDHVYTGNTISVTTSSYSTNTVEVYYNQKRSTTSTVTGSSQASNTTYGDNGAYTETFTQTVTYNSVTVVTDATGGTATFTPNPGIYTRTAVYDGTTLNTGTWVLSSGANINTPVNGNTGGYSASAASMGAAITFDYNYQTSTNISAQQVFNQLGIKTTNSTATSIYTSVTPTEISNRIINNKFNSKETGITDDVNSDLTIASTSGRSEVLNELMVDNFGNFLGDSPVYGDYGEDYTPDFFAKKLLSFFGGVDADDVKQGTTDAGTPPASTYYIETVGSNGKALIDGKEHDIDSANKVTVTGEDGVQIQYTFEAGMAGKGGVAFAKNDMQEVSVTYEQLANGYSFNDLVSSINSLGLNVRATYDSLQDRFSIYNKESGAENQINISFNALTTTDTNLDAATNRTVDFFNNLNLRQYTSEGIDTDSGNGADLTDFDYNFNVNKVSTLSGQNAIVKIDGIDYNDLQKNNLTVGGVTYNFNAVTNNNIDSATNTITSSGDISKVVVNVSQNTENIVAKVKSFVEDYNAIMKKLYEWYDEKPNDNYKPLTASQKEGMKDEQIEKWEEKAKAGLLYHDKTLYSVISEMRAVISDRVEGVTGKYNNIFALGISTTGTKGQLVIDEEKLNAALAADPDSVYNIFAKLDKGETQYLVTRNGKQIWTANKQAGDETVYEKDGKTPRTKVVERSSYNGIAQRLSTILNTGMKNLRTVAGSTEDISEDSDLNNLLRELQTKMSNFQTMMKAFETALYKKYDAMESSLALLGAQLNYVTGAFQ